MLIVDTLHDMIVHDWAGKLRAAFLLVIALSVVSCGPSTQSDQAARSGPLADISWQLLRSAKGPARMAASIADDPMNGGVLLFGGFGHQLGVGVIPMGGTWILHGAKWKLTHPSIAPPARAGGAMAYDAATHAEVLFGGVAGFGKADYGDTWIWNGSTWTQEHPPTSPSPRTAALMAYDGATKTVVLFGGHPGFAPSGPGLDDTWIWNGSNWKEALPAARPTTAGSSAMAYDGTTRNLVLFSGRSLAARYGDTWTWNGTTWTELHPRVSPPSRLANGQLAYLAPRKVIVLFSGKEILGKEVSFRKTNVRDDTWTWNGTTWTELHPPVSPPGRTLGMLAFDSVGQRAVLVGGQNNLQAEGITATWTIR